MPELIPALLVQDATEFRTRLGLVEGIARCVQLDCMDGHFVSNRTWYEAGTIDTTLEIELHLMVTDPLAVIREWKRVPQVVRAFWHLELPADHQAIINECRALGWECGFAVSPDTPAERLTPYAETTDAVLVMGVTPGWSGQKLIPSTLEKVKQIKERWPGLVIGFDGGVTRGTIPDLLAAGVDRVCAASAIFRDAHPRAAAQSLQRLIEGS
jgi:ribulose-phosphate 3-epimerase